MAVEESLLAQLAEHPEDDVTRLVYADWLEERGDRRAEYLRLELALARSPEGSVEATVLEGRLRVFQPGMDHRWLRRAGKRFGVWLVAIPPARKIWMIRATRLTTGRGLAEAKGFVESLPRALGDNLTFPEAGWLRDRFLLDSAASRRNPGEDPARLAIRPMLVPTWRDPELALAEDGNTPCDLVLVAYPQADWVQVVWMVMFSLEIARDAAEQTLRQPLPITLAHGVERKMAEAMAASFRGLAEVEIRESN